MQGEEKREVRGRCSRDRDLHVKGVNFLHYFLSSNFMTSCTPHHFHGMTKWRTIIILLKSKIAKKSLTKPQK